jgi:predicted O-methyltransferase YrrM
MPIIVGPEIETYLYQILPSRDPVLSHMEDQARKRGIPIVGPTVGRFLHFLALLHKPKKIYEMGSAIGYSTIWWAKAAGPDGEVHYTDGNPDNEKEAKQYFKQAGVEKIVKTHVGNALQIIDELPGEFDLIFCDIDKNGYPEAFHKAYPRLKKGGLLVADNVLWSGTVALPSKAPVDTHGGRKWVEAVKEFNRLIYETPGLFTTIIPLRDGVSVSLKLK